MFFFDVLQESYPQLYNMCTSMERRFKEVYGVAESTYNASYDIIDAYSDCLVRIRKCLEAILQESTLHYNITVISERERPSAYEMINALKNAGCISTETANTCHNVRMSCNASAHSNENESAKMIRQITKSSFDGLCNVISPLLFGKTSSRSGVYKNAYVNSAPLGYSYLDKHQVSEDAKDNVKCPATPIMNKKQKSRMNGNRFWRTVYWVSILILLGLCVYASTLK